MKAISRWIEVIENILLIVGVLSSVAISATGVFFRYVLNSSLGFVEEVAGFLLLMVVMVGIGAAVRRGSHLRVDMLIQFWPKTRKRLNIFADVIAFGVMSILFICAIKFVYMLWEGDQRTTTMWWLPVYIPLIIMPTGFATALFRLVENLIKLIKTPGDLEAPVQQTRPH